MTTRSLWTVLVSTALLTGCPPKDGPEPEDTGDMGIDCTADARASAQIDLVDAEGASVSGASLSWSTDEGEGSCEEFVAGQYVCGWEVGGAMHIVAEADGYASAEVEVFVEEDECHVLTEMLELVLEAL
jgi:hypothetical protein